MDIITVLKSLGTGIAVGVLFSLLKLPIPAPDALAGVLGVAGIFLGYIFIKWLLPHF